MSKRAAALYLKDILTAIDDIEAFTTDFVFEEFCNDKKTIAAVVRNLEILGEAARNIPREMRADYPNIPWEKMVSMRNKVLHEYFGVDEEILWKTIHEDLPPLKEQISNLSEMLKT